MQLSALTTALGRFVGEQQRRKVLRVAAGYAVVGWIVLQVAVALEASMNLPQWFDTVVVSFLLIGFPIALVASWLFEFTPEGIKRTASSAGEGSIVKPQTTDLILAGALGIVVVVALVQLLMPGTMQGAPPTVAEAPKPKLAPPALGDKSIAVLPFANLSPDKENEYFADGLTEELLNLLAKIGDLRVVSRTSSFAFKGKNTPLPEIAKQLGVRHVLEGSVRKDGNDLRITAQLIDVTSDTHLWSETYERKVDDVFDLQDRIAHTIVEALKIEVTLTSRAAHPPTKNMDAYRHYLEGLNLYRNRSGPTGLAVIDKFRAATRLDPDFAEAHAALAISYYSTIAGRVSRAAAKQNADLARASAEAAIKLNPNLSLPYTVLGALDRKALSWRAAMANYDRAMALDPKDPLSGYFLGILQGSLGYTEKAANTLTRVLETDPLFDRPRMYMMAVELARGNGAAAEALARRLANSGSFPLYGIGNYHLAGLARDRGEIDKALAHLKAAAPALQDRPFMAAIGAAIRSPAARQRAISALKAETASNPAFDPVPYYGFLGETDVIFTTIDSWFATGDAWQLDTYSMTVMWASRPFIADARFKPLVMRLGLVDLWKKQGWPDKCRPKGEDDFECS
jgi:TolB-like protein